MFLRTPKNYFSPSGDLLPFEDSLPDGPSPKTPPEKWPTEFSSFESLFTIPVAFVAARTLTRQEGVLLCEISRLGAKLDMIIRLYVQEVQRTQIFEQGFRTFQNAPGDVLPLIPLIQSGATQSLNHVKELYRHFELTVAELRKAKDGLITWMVANRGFSKDPDSGKSAAEKRRQLADAEEILLQRIEQLLAAKGDVYKHTNQSWQQILQQITDSSAEGLKTPPTVASVTLPKPSATAVKKQPISSSPKQQQKEKDKEKEKPPPRNESPMRKKEKERENSQTNDSPLKKKEKKETAISATPPPPSSSPTTFPKPKFSYSKNSSSSLFPSRAEEPAKASSAATNKRSRSADANLLSASSSARLSQPASPILDSSLVPPTTLSKKRSHPEPDTQNNIVTTTKSSSRSSPAPDSKSLLVSPPSQHLSHEESEDEGQEARSVELGGARNQAAEERDEEQEEEGDGQEEKEAQEDGEEADQSDLKRNDHSQQSEVDNEDFD